MLVKISCFVTISFLVITLSACSGRSNDYAVMQTNSGLTRISAGDLYTAFSKDATQANKDWDGQEIEVYGTVRSIQQDLSGAPTFLFETGKEQGANRVSCHLSGDYSRLRKGKPVLVRGKVVYSRTIQLWECEVLAPKKAVN